MTDPKMVALADVALAYGKIHLRPTVEEFLRDVNNERLDREIQDSLDRQKRLADQSVPVPYDPSKDAFNKEMKRFDRLMKERFPE